MKKNYLVVGFLISTILIFTPTSIGAQLHLQSAQLIEDFSPTQIDSFLTLQGIPVGMVPIRNSIKVYKITYSTLSWDSITPTVATGVIFLPQGNDNCQRPILNYCHGTIIKKVDAPSYKVGEYVVGISFSANGYIVVMPDYLGLGSVSPGLHPYIHANSEATAVVHMLRSSKEWMDSINYSYSDQLFLTGYSQGGHASMAAHRLIQQELPTEFTVTAAAPLSGPYDVSGVQAEVITRDSSYGAPGYLPFVLFSYNMVYGMYSNWDAVLDTPYNIDVPPLMDGLVSLGIVENFVSDTPNLIILPLLLDTFTTDMSHRFRLALKKNDLWDWAPQCPVKMGYCQADELVSYKNAIACRDSMIARGAPDVQAIDINPSLSHGDCALFALMAVNNFFGTLRQDLLDLSLSVTNESSAGANDGSILTTLSGGIPGYTYQWSNSTSDTILSNIGAGTYSVTITDSYGCTATGTANIGVVGIENAENAPEINIYPNPATDQFTIQLSNFQHDIRVSIVDLVGKVAYNKTIQTGTEFVNFNTIGFSKGIYLIKISSGNYTIARKIIIR